MKKTYNFKLTFKKVSREKVHYTFSQKVEDAEILPTIEAWIKKIRRSSESRLTFFAAKWNQ